MRRHLSAIAVVTAILALVLVGAGCGDVDGAARDGTTAPTTAGARPTPSGAPRHVIYFSEFKVHTVLERLLPHGPGPLENIAAYRQMPANQTILPPPFRIARVNSEEIASMTAAQMAARLRRAINHTCTARMPCHSHLVAIDDINVDFRGRAGRRLLTAMRLLDTPSPWGGTYARRVMMYVPIQLVDGLGDEAVRESWAAAAKAVALGETYWIEMYESTGTGRMGDVDYDDWVGGVRTVIDAIVAAGGHVSRAHFMMGPGVGAIDGMPRGMCPDRIGCAWDASTATPLNRRITRNGIGTYRFGPRQLTVLCLEALEARDGQDRLSHATLTAMCDNWTSNSALARLARS